MFLKLNPFIISKHSDIINVGLNSLEMRKKKDYLWRSQNSEMIRLISCSLYTKVFFRHYLERAVSFALSRKLEMKRWQEKEITASDAKNSKRAWKIKGVIAIFTQAIFDSLKMILQALENTFQCCIGVILIFLCPWSNKHFG